MVQPPTLLYTVYSPLLLPYSHAAYSPFLNSDEPQEKKTNWNKAKQPPKEGGRISQVAKELQIQQLSLEDPYPALLHQYPRILDIITSRERTWGQCLTSFYWLSLLISWCWFLNIFKSCCILSVRTKRIHVKASTNSQRQSHNLRCFTVIVSLRLLAEHQNHIRKNQNLTIRIIPSASQTRKN